MTESVREVAEISQNLYCRFAVQRILPLIQIVSPEREGAELELFLERQVQELLEEIGDKGWLGGGGEEVAARLQSVIPFVTWQELSESMISFSVFACHRYRGQVLRFVSEMLSRWLLPGREPAIYSTHSIVFRLPEVGESDYHLLQLRLHVGQRLDRATALRNLPRIVREIRLGLQSRAYGRFVCDGKMPDGDLKTQWIHETLVGLMGRRPAIFKPDLLTEMQRFLLRVSGDFRAVRDVRHMCRVVSTHYVFREQLRRDVRRFANQRHLYLRLLPLRLRFQFGVKPVIGLVIGLNRFSERELFGRRHVAQALRRLYPDFGVTANSFFTLRQGDELTELLYLEIEKRDGSPFTLGERRQLKESLPEELKESVEHLSHPLFVRINEEEVLRRVRALSGELRLVRDIPHVSISFVEQSSKTLTFNIILLRLGEDPPLEFEKVRFSLGEQKIVGQLRGRYNKEASIFTLEFDKAPFLRKNYSVDLYKSRQYVVSLLTQQLGEVRDYNGGFILKQNEALGEAISLLGSEVNEDLIENLFFSLTPVTMQSYLRPERICHFYELFSDLLRSPVEARDGYVKRSHQGSGAFMMAIRVEWSGAVEMVEQAASSLEIPTWQLAQSVLEIHGSHYMGFIYLEEDGRLVGRLKRAVGRAIEAWSRKQQSRQILRINLLRFMKSLDPRVGADRRSGVLTKMLYEGLTRIGRDGRPELAAAERVTISADQKKYTFRLRESFWSDGRPVTAMDFAYAWRKVLEPQFFHRWIYLFKPIKGAHAAKGGQLPIDQVGITVVDAQTLTVELEHPTPYFLDLAAHWIYSPLQQAIDDQEPGWAQLTGERFVCNGPFQLVAMKQDGKLHLVKNRLYWDADSVHLEYIDVHSIEDPSQVAQMYRQGDLDIIGEPLCALPSEMRDEEADWVNPSGGLFWGWFNTERSPFSSRKMRLAFALAVDRQRLLEEHGRQGERPAWGLLPQSLSLGAGRHFTDGNRERARALFEDGLQELGIGREQLAPILVTAPAVGGENMLARGVLRQWQEVLGIETELEEVPLKGIVDHCQRQEFHVAFITWYSWFADPCYLLEHFKEKGEFLNPTGWENAQYAALLDEADNDPIPRTRRDALRRAEALLMEEMPVAPLVQRSYHGFVNPKLQGVAVSSLGQIDFKEARFGDIASSTPRDQGVVRFPLPYNSLRFDPRKESDSLLYSVFNLLYEGLMRFDRDGEPQLALASQMELSPCGRIYTFTLRQCCWSDGTPLVAEHFVESWRELISPAYHTRFEFLLMPVKNARLVKGGELPHEKFGVKALDDRTLQIELSHPAPHFLQHLCFPVMAAVKGRGGDTLGCGPFVVSSQSPEQTRLAPNPYYWNRDAVGVAGVVFRSVEDGWTALSMFQQGELDFVGDPLVSIPERSGAVATNTLPTHGIYSLLVNCRLPQFQSSKIRRAIAYAIRRDRILDHLDQSEMKPADSILPHALTLNEGSIFGDESEALALFEEGLAEVGFTRATFPPIVLSHGTVEGLSEVMEAVRRDLKRVLGIQVDMECCNWRSHLGRLGKGDFQLGALPWWPWVHDPVYHLDVAKRKSRSFNWSQWEDEEYIRLLDRAQHLEGESRDDVLGEAERLVMREMPIIPLFNMRARFVTSERLDGVVVSERGILDLAHLQVKEENDEKNLDRPAAAGSGLLTAR
jgi:oligopeptide transport system substrate-binding protein